MDDQQRTNMGYNWYGQRSKAGGRRVTSTGIHAGEFSKCRRKTAVAGMAVERAAGSRQTKLQLCAKFQMTSAMNLEPQEQLEGNSALCSHVCAPTL